MRKFFSMKEIRRINAILGNKLLKYSTKKNRGKFVSILKEIRVFEINYPKNYTIKKEEDKKEHLEVISMVTVMKKSEGLEDRIIDTPQKVEKKKKG